ncbi:Mobile element protein [Frigoriglobus tundricola]|uniref:Mobile element protein n=1 Tax=Frigoriglobus tundricola TaxID=2774151 RepID=A0A6M5YS90_9BACT|nr:Mobile element protein [Frigoriglobus tundricola]
MAPTEPAPGPRFARTRDTGHGRVGHRTRESTPILTVHEKWPS